MINLKYLDIPILIILIALFLFVLAMFGLCYYVALFAPVESLDRMTDAICGSFFFVLLIGALIVVWVIKILLAKK